MTRAIDLLNPAKRELWMADLEITTQIAMYRRALEHGRNTGEFDKVQYAVGEAIIDGMEKVAKVVRERLDAL